MQRVPAAREAHEAVVQRAREEVEEQPGPDPAAVEDVADHERAEALGGPEGGGDAAVGHGPVVGADEGVDEEGLDRAL